MSGIKKDKGTPRKFLSDGSSATAQTTSYAESFFNMGGKRKKSASFYVLVFIFAIQVIFVGLFVYQMHHNAAYYEETEQQQGGAIALDYTSSANIADTASLPAPSLSASEPKLSIPSTQNLRKKDSPIAASDVVGIGSHVNGDQALASSSSSGSGHGGISIGDEEQEILDTERAKLRLAAKTFSPGDLSKSNTRESHLDKVYMHHTTGRPQEHMKLAPINFNPIKPKPSSAQKRVSEKKPEHYVLVVGGTDGSGTRRAVQLLADLGVPMVVEDGGTNDVHADFMPQGWPMIIRPFLRYSGSIEADPDFYPDDIKENSIKKLTALLDKAAEDSHYWKNPTQGGRRSTIDAGVLSIPNSIKQLSSRVYYGIKAPCMMTALPFLHKIVPRLMYLQVVRDGRDIAFTSNLSPIRKHYEDMYGSADKDKNLIDPVKSIRLWSDWNARSALWATNHSQTTKGGYVHENDFALDYHLFKMEDLMDESIAVRYKAIKSLSTWVGSSATDMDMCKMAKSELKDQGASGNSRKGKGVEVSKRYGKWKKSKKEVIDELERYGAEGLELFGYFDDGDSEHIQRMHKNLTSPCT